MSRSTFIVRGLLQLSSAALAAVLLSAGCDDTVDAVKVAPTSDAAVPTDGAAKSDAPPGTGTSASQTIGASGGSVALDNIVVTIPAGALPSDKTIVVTATSAPAPSGYTLYSPIYKFEPEGITFAAPVSVAIKFTAGSANPSLFWSQASGVGYDDLRGTVSGNTMTGSVTHFSTGFVGQLTPLSTDASTDAPADSSIADGSVDGSVDAGVDSAVVDAGVDSAVVDAGVDSAVVDSGVSDAPADGPLSCVTFSATAQLVTNTNVATAMPAFTGGTITPGFYHLVDLFTYTGVGGATGSSAGIQTQTIHFTDTVYEGIITIPASSIAQSFAATYMAAGSALTFTKTCGGIVAQGSNFTATSNELRLQAGGNSVQRLVLQ